MRMGNGESWRAQDKFETRILVARGNCGGKRARL